MHIGPPANPGDRSFWCETGLILDAVFAHRATVSRIVNGKTAVTVEMSIRLGAALKLSPDFFIKAQVQYDLWRSSRKKRPAIRPLAA